MRNNSAHYDLSEERADQHIRSWDDPPWLDIARRKLSVTRKPLFSSARVIPSIEHLLMTISALFDPKAFPQPATSMQRGPLDKCLHFDYGMHQCYGRMISGVVLPALVARLCSCRICCGLRAGSDRCL